MSLLDELHQERMHALYRAIDANYSAIMAVEDAEWKRRIDNLKLKSSLVVATDLLDLAREICS